MQRSIKMKKIKSPAIKSKDGTVTKGGPDHQAIKDKKGVVGKRGFVDSNDKFLSISIYLHIFLNISILLN